MEIGLLTHLVLPVALLLVLVIALGFAVAGRSRVLLFGLLHREFEQWWQSNAVSAQYDGFGDVGHDSVSPNARETVTLAIEVLISIFAGKV
jgi:hypothetical protein